MSIHPQHASGKGSLRLIQDLVNNKSVWLNSEIERLFPSISSQQITWVSPLKATFEEYRDNDFLKFVGLDPSSIQLGKFWPKGGPQWDALAKTSSGQVILVEAKANIPELNSSCQAKAVASINLINQSLEETKEYLGVNSQHDWLKPYYQAANRLAHLYFLRQKCGVDAYLLNIYFVNAVDVNGPSSNTIWQPAIDQQKIQLGINKPNPLSSYCGELFV